MHSMHSFQWLNEFQPGIPGIFLSHFCSILLFIRHDDDDGKWWGLCFLLVMLLCYLWCILLSLDDHIMMIAFVPWKTKVRECIRNLIHFPIIVIHFFVSLVKWDVFDFTLEWIWTTHYDDYDDDDDDDYLLPLPSKSNVIYMYNMLTHNINTLHSNFIPSIFLSTSMYVHPNLEQKTVFE